MSVKLPYRPRWVRQVTHRNCPKCPRCRALRRGILADLRKRQNAPLEQDYENQWLDDADPRCARCGFPTTQCMCT